MGVFLNDWAACGQAEMLEDFGIAADALAGAEVLVASYTAENYEGSAYVLFRLDGKLWEVHGSHCSCHGLGEQSYSGTGGTQWEPEETTTEAALAYKHRYAPGVADAVRAALAPSGEVL